MARTGFRGVTAAPAVRALNCGNCGGAIELRAAGSTVSLICPHCGSTLDATDPDFRLIERANTYLRVPRIPLGTRGKLEGVEWEAVGYMERRSEDGGWSEYLLFNPYHGYRFLADDGERFSLGRLLDRAPEIRDGRRAVLDGRAFPQVEPAYPARVTFVVGEFYWRVRVGDTVVVTDFGRGVQSLTSEQNASERTWTSVRRLDRGVAERSFNIVDVPPLRAESDRGELGSGWAPIGETVKIAALAIAALIFVTIAASWSGKLLLRRDLAITLDGPAQTLVMGPLDLTRRRNGLTVQTETSGLDNGWVDLDFSLVERRSQQSFDAAGTAERYHGRDSDGDWSEGDPVPRTRFSNVPAGSYDLVMEAAGHRWTGSGSDGSGVAAAVVPAVVTVRRGAWFAENFWLAFVLIVAWPAVLIWRWFR